MSVYNEGYNKPNNFFIKGYKNIILDNYNNKFIDLTSSGGTSLLGHNNYILKKSISKFVNNKFSNFALPNEHARNLRKNIKKILPQFSKIIFCNSGAEANLKAIRIARAITGKDKIINITGSWHGSIDQFLFFKDSRGKTIKLSDGLEKDIEKKIIYAPYNNFEKTKKIIDKFSVLKDYKSDLTFEWTLDPGSPVDDSVIERKNRWIEALERDFYISEAVSVLEDLNINLENYPIAQIKK
mgnify:CR=1 FL=1